MELTVDATLTGPIWKRVIDELAPIFASKPNYSVFVLSIALGIMYDKRIEKMDNPDDLPDRTVPRNVMSNQNQETGILDFMFQTAILTTKTLDLPEDERLSYAFGDRNPDFNKIKFLTEFANFGVGKLVELIDDDNELQTMDNIKDFLHSTLEDTNYDIIGLSDEYLLDDDEL